MNINNFIKLYDETQNMEFQKICFDERNIFNSVIYADKKDIVKIKSESELCFNVDREHTNRSKYIFNDLCNGLTIPEFENIKFINNKISQNQNNWYEKTFPLSTILMHTYQHRLIKKKFPNAKNILEIGPGSGYLSILLSRDKKNIFTTDIFQPHYIFQNFIYSICANLNELVENKNFNLNDGAINHIPWWKFRKLKGDEFKIDLVVMNHMIVEMENNSLRKLLNFLSNAIVNNPPIICESLGYFKYNSPEYTFNTLKEFNYSLHFSGGHTKKTAKVYIFKKNLDTKKTKHKKLNKELFRFIPFGKVIHLVLSYSLQEFKNYLNKIYNYKKNKDLKNSVIFKEKNKINYDDLINYYNDNNFNLLSSDEEFHKKLYPNNK